MVKPPFDFIEGVIHVVYEIDVISKYAQILNRLGKIKVSVRRMRSISFRFKKVLGFSKLHEVIGILGVFAVYDQVTVELH